MEWRPLRESLSDWTDWDVTGYALGLCLGLWEPEPALGSAKHVFWSRHPVGELLLGMLDSMTASGILERREEPDVQYRWNGAFERSWARA